MHKTRLKITESCSVVFKGVATQKSLWTFRISVENKQINHPRCYYCYLVLFQHNSFKCQTVILTYTGPCKYLKVAYRDDGSRLFLGCTEIMVRGNVSGCNRRKSRHKELFSPWARPNIISCWERMWNLHSWSHLKMDWKIPIGIWSGCISF